MRLKQTTMRVDGQTIHTLQITVDSRTAAQYPFPTLEDHETLSGLLRRLAGHIEHLPFGTQILEVDSSEYHGAPPRAKEVPATEGGGSESQGVEPGSSGER